MSTVSGAGGADLPVVMVENGQTADGASMMQISKPAAADDKCMPPGLNAPSAKAKLVNDDEIRRATDCLDAAGQDYTITEFDGLRAVEPKDKAELSRTVLHLHLGGPVAGVDAVRRSVGQALPGCEEHVQRVLR